MSATVTCQQCHQSFAAAPHLYGKTVACPGCGAALTIPHEGMQLTTAQYLTSLPQDSPGTLSSLPQDAYRPASRKRKSSKAHSTGGTLPMLTAAATDRFRAVFAFGPVDDVAGYGLDVLPFNPWNARELLLRNPCQWLHAMNSPVFALEGSRGNISCLRSMRRASTNPQLHFHVVRGADHFNILAPITGLLAEKIQQDTGPTCNIQLADEELGRRFR